MGNGAASATDHIADFARRLELGRIPLPVRAEARRAILDTIGVMLAGARRPLARRIAEHARAVRSGGICTVPALAPMCLAPCGAALANGAAAHVLDWDDTTYEGLAHASAVVLPAALALAESEGADGAELLCGYVAGVETVSALGRGFGDTIYYRGTWTSALLGVIGSAAAAARILRLGAEEARNAVGLAAAQAFGTHAVFGTEAKPLLLGRAAEIGVEAALLARAGLGGPRTVIEGQAGLAAVLNDGGFARTALDELGARWSLTGGAFARKLFPLCSSAQAAAEGMQMLTRAHGLAAGDIAAVQAEVTPLVRTCLVHADPRTTSEAQFSMPFAIACVALHGTVGPEHLDPAVIGDPAVRAMMTRVGMAEDKGLVATSEQRRDHPEAARLAVRTRDGRTLMLLRGAATGMPAQPMSNGALEAKFLACALPVLGDNAARDLLARLNAIEEVPAVSGLLVVAGEG